ncbi:alpha/beta hydrolase [Flavihumibacter rivuli]|uniref:alpha/beta hydrolase n=1 Tax=Flavihumibacter rivuli TaxID=2838156 RepID=UPI001BDED401|nr:alpha/beta hydrolase [Flavihumibacter rivuli]ULQ56708.1 alpha/beta hydrolase [Flavihumibacter rivuli]
MQLGQDFHYQTLQLKDDYEGAVTATLIAAKANRGSRRSILYVHGFIDYFFHPHLAEAFLNSDIDFYALELRKYGHSLLSHQHPNYCRDMKEYFEELDLAIQTIRTQGKASSILLLGHSTGGLLTSYYMNKGRERDSIEALILNSPFLAFNEPFLARQMIPLVAGLISSISPFAKKDNALSPVYAQSVHKDHYGEWDFNLEWKPIEGFPAYFAWARAVAKSQSFLQKHSAIGQPILLMHSSNSFKPKTFTPETLKADTVLNKDDIARIGKKLGNNVDTIEIKDGMHDLFLSPAPVRTAAIEKMIDWINRFPITGKQDA